MSSTSYFSSCNYKPLCTSLLYSALRVINNSVTSTICFPHCFSRHLILSSLKGLFQSWQNKKILIVNQSGTELFLPEDHWNLQCMNMHKSQSSVQHLYCVTVWSRDPNPFHCVTSSFPCIAKHSPCCQATLATCNFLPQTREVQGLSRLLMSALRDAQRLDGVKPREMADTHLPGNKNTSRPMLISSHLTQPKSLSRRSWSFNENDLFLVHLEKNPVSKIK